MYNPLLFPHLWSRLVANSILQNHNKKHSNLTCKSARNVALPARKTCSFWQQFCDMEVIYNFYYIQKFSTWQICREEWGVWIMYKDEQNLLLSSYPSLFMTDGFTVFKSYETLKWWIQKSVSVYPVIPVMLFRIKLHVLHSISSYFFKESDSVKKKKPNNN